jgi:hypothetical protein
MKTSKLLGLLVLVLLSLITIPLFAQSMNVSGTLRIKIPVQFTVNTQTLPAGEYIVARVFDNSIQLKNIDGGNAVVALTSTLGGGIQIQGPKLVFNRYGNRYFLTEVWLGKADTGRQLFASAEEIELARIQSQRRLIVAGH